jgi:hypothetical protein
MELGAAREHHLARGDKGGGYGLSALRDELLTVERDGDGIAERSEATLGNGRRGRR